MIHMRAFNKFEEANITFLTQKSVKFTLVQITATGYKKSILDATEPMRQYFLENGMHDYSRQMQGQENKVTVPTFILDEVSGHQTMTSLYRPNTKKGDPRLWPNRMKQYCNPDDILMMLYHDTRLWVVNITQIDIANVCSSPLVSPLKDLIVACNRQAMSVSAELTALLRDIACEWHPTEVLADTGVGRAVEALLGIEMNNSKQPDYKGIELKSYRDKRPSIRATLFTQVPDWSISRLKSAKQIVREYGYMSNGCLTYQSTLRCTSPNAQNLGLTLYDIEERLAIEEKRKKISGNGDISYPKVADVALWQLSVLHERLLSKHHDTFWIEVETKIENGHEFFRPTLAEYTKNPILSQFDTLLDTGYISVDLLLSRPSGHGDTIAFKIKKKAKPMLFPENEKIMLR